MLNRSASLAMSTSVLKSLPGKLDIKIHSPSILYLWSVWEGGWAANFNVSHNFLTTGPRVLIFQMCLPCGI